MSSKQPHHSIAFSRHNHHHCQQTLLDEATKLCHQRDVRFTRRRRQVFEVLLGGHQPMGAYEVLRTLNKTEQNITPPIVYRALDFLLEQGLAHRIESENAFVPCMYPGHQCEAQFLICTKCHCVAELDHAVSPVIDMASQIGFEIRHAVIEISGLCASCRQQ